MTVQQVYGTHCTFGSSALERHNEELADVVFGYSARAGSLDPAALRAAYQRLEPCLHYYLPADTPAAQRLHLSADSAPRRLVFLPSLDGLQVVGQVCYRTTDCEGRPGSYFAHLAFHEDSETAPRWTAVDVLKLWNAPGWQTHDRADLPHRLPALSGLAELLAGRRPAIDDQVLWSFLTTPRGNTFDDPGEVIPPRWRSADPLQRQAAFSDVLEAALDVSRGLRRSLLLVAEPSMAALLFYGVARLLPPGPLRAGLSFSTFEGSVEQCHTALAATWFHAPAKTDLPAELYRGPVAVLNTANGRRPEPVGTPGIYAQRMVIRLVEHGWAALDRTLAGFRNAGAKTAEDLELLAQLQRTATDLLAPNQPPPEPGWRDNPASVRFLQHALASELAGMGPPAAALRPIVGTPSHLVLIELLAADALTPITRPALEFLLGELPAEQLGELLRLEHVDRAHRADALARSLAAHRRWPPGMEPVWDEAARVPDAAKPNDSVLGLALARLDPTTQAALWSSTPEDRADAFLAALWEASQRDWRGLAAVAAVVPEMTLVRLFQRVGPGLLQGWPAGATALAARLDAMLGTLHDQPDEFAQRLDFLLAGRHLVTGAAEQSRLDAWGTFRQAVKRIGELQQQAGRGLRQVPVAELESACRTLAEAVAVVLGPVVLPDDADGAARLERTRLLARYLLEGDSLLPPGVWQYEALWEKIGWYFRAGVWPTTSLRRMLPGRHGWSARQWAVLAVVVLAAIGLTWALFASKGRLPGRATRPSPEVANRPGLKPTLPVAPPEPVSDSAITPEPGPSPIAPASDPVAPSNDPVPPVEPSEPSTEQSPQEVDVAAEPTPQEAEAAWLRQALQFKADHDGLVIETPFPDGHANIPLSMLGGWRGDPAKLLLPAVWLDLEGGGCPLGSLSDTPAPGRSVSSPALAARAGLTTARITLETDSEFLTITLEGEAPEIVEEVDQLTRIRQRRARIESLLRLWERPDTPVADRLQARDDLARLIQWELPTPLPKPQADDPQYQANSDAYLAALAAYNDSQHVLTLREREIGPRARKEMDRLDELVRSDPNALHLAEAVPPEDSAPLAALRARCRRVLLVVYVPSLPTPVAAEPAAPVPAETAMAEAQRPEEPAVALDGKFTVQTTRARRPSTLTMAQVKPLVYLPNGRLLPEGYARERRMRIACRIEERKADGTRRDIAIDDIHVQGPQDIFRGATSLVVRFEFFQRELVGAGERRFGESPQYTVDGLEADSLVTPKFQFTPEGLQTLERLTSGL